MPKNFKLSSLQNPSSIARLVVGFLLLTNLVGAYFVIRPPGGSPDELRAQISTTSSQLRQMRTTLDRTRLLMSKIQSGRDQGDSFLSEFFLPSSRAYSTVFSELLDLAKNSGMTTKESTYTIEPVEGSDTLSMMTISQNLEGKYDGLIKFVNALDKSDRLLIVDSLSATPLNTGALNVVLKLQTFVRDDSAGLLKQTASVKGGGR